MKTLWVLMMLVVGACLADINNPPVIDASWQSNKYSQVNGEAASNLAASAKSTADLALPKAGGSMSGVLDMGGNSITNIGTNSLVFMDGTKISSSSNGVLKVGAGTNLSTVVTSGNIQTYAPTPPVYLADGITTKKSGTTFSVANWIPNNLTDLYTQFLVQQGATSRGLLDGPGYLFNDQNGILPALSTNQVYDSRGYKNKVDMSEGSGDPDLSLFFNLNESDSGNVIVDSIGGVTVTNTALNNVTAATGKLGGGYSNNHDNVCYAQHSGGLSHFKSNDFTCGVWYKYEESSLSDGAQIFSFDFDTAGFGINMWFGDIICVGFNNYPQNNGTSYPVNEWIHIMVTWTDANICTVYTNGVFGWTLDTGDTPIAISDNYTIYIGGAEWWSRLPKGTTDGAVYFKRSLTSGEVADYYNNIATVTENIQMSEPITTNSMLLVCTNKVLDFIPTATWVSILASGTGLTTNDIQGFVSPDYGTNWYQASLVPQNSIDLSNTLFQGVATFTNNVDSSNMVLKAVTTSNKVVKVLGMWGPSN